MSNYSISSVEPKMQKILQMPFKPHYCTVHYLSCYLGLWAGAIWGEGILPLRQTKVGYHQSIVGGEGCRQKMPAQRAIDEPNFTLLGYNTCKTQSKLLNDPK